MNKSTKTIFTLTESEVKGALYDFYERKLKELDISAYFSPQEIKIEADNFEVSLTITGEIE